MREIDIFEKKQQKHQMIGSYLEASKKCRFQHPQQGFATEF